MTGRESLLTSVLDCGEADLSILDDVQYDWCDLIEPGDEVKRLTQLMDAVFRHGFGEIAVAVSDRICELEAVVNERELDAEEEQELTALRGLTPRKDFSTYCNCLDTHVYCVNHGKTSLEYMSEALDAFADNTGFDISALEG